MQFRPNSYAKGGQFSRLIVWFKEFIKSGAVSINVPSRSNIIDLVISRCTGSSYFGVKGSKLVFDSFSK